MGKNHKNMLKLSNRERKDLTIDVESVNKKEIPKYWERDYINEKIEEIENYNHKMLLIFLWYSGVRITEAVSLRKNKIDFKNHIMTLRWLKSRKYKERNCPIQAHLRDMLQLYTSPMKSDALVFPITRQRAWQLCQKYMGGKPHMFRHSFAVNWLRCKGDIIVLHRILGHSKVQTTMEYLKIVPEDQGRELMKIQFR